VAKLFCITTCEVRIAVDLMQASGGWESLGPFWKKPMVLHRASLRVLWVLHDYCLPEGDLPVPVENTDHALSEKRRAALPVLEPRW
jgi:hypothetical protein